MTHDSINSPSHYAEGRQFETISVIEDWELGYRLGNAVKYISRAGRKDPEKTLEDLKKAQWYLAREIESIEGIKPFERSYEEIVESLRFYGESQDNPIAWPEPASESEVNEAFETRRRQIGAALERAISGYQEATGYADLRAIAADVRLALGGFNAAVRLKLEDLAPSSWPRTKLVQVCVGLFGY